MELGRALAREVECKLVTFGRRSSSERSGDLEVKVLESAMFLSGHPAHPVPRGLMRELDGGDIIHTHHMRALPSRVAAVAARVRGRHRVVTDHGLGAGRGPKVLARLYERFLTVSRYSAETLRVPEHKTVTIYGGADPDRFHPGRWSDRSGVLFVGRVTPHKGIDRLIRALPVGTSLTVAGSPGHDPRLPERDYPALLTRLAEDRNVRFLRRVEEDQLAELYRGARVLVLPSVNETCYGRHIQIPELLGLALLEAMASGTPVVATRVGGLPEVIRDGDTGFLVEPGDIDALRARLELLLGDERLARELGENARQHVLERFTWEKCAQRCLNAYDDLMGAA